MGFNSGFKGLISAKFNFSFFCELPGLLYINFSLYSWFQTSAVFWMLYAFLWVIPRRLNFIFRRFGTLCLFHFHRQVGVNSSHLPTYVDGTDCFETLAYKIQTTGNCPEECIQHLVCMLVTPCVCWPTLKNILCLSYYCGKCNSIWGFLLIYVPVLAFYFSLFIAFYHY